MIIRFASASQSRFCRSRCWRCVLIFTVGYPADLRADERPLPRAAHGKAVWLSHGFMFGRLVVGLAGARSSGWRLIRADLCPTCSPPGTRRRPAAPSAVRPVDPRLRRQRRRPPPAVRPIRHLAPVYVVTYAIVLTLIAFDGIMALQPHWFSNLLRRVLLHGLVPRRAHAARPDDDLRRLAPRRGRPRLAQAAPRPRQAVFRLHGVLDLSHVGPVPGDLVRQHARGDRIRLLAAVGPLAAGRQGWCSRDVHRARSSACSGVAPKKVRVTFGFFASDQPGLALARALPAGDAVGDARSRAR